MIDNDRELASNELFDKKKRKKFNVSRLNTSRQRRENRDDEIFLRSSAFELLEELEKRLNNLVEESASMLERDSHRERRMTQFVENNQSQSQTVMNISQSLEHDISNSDREESIDQDIHHISDSDEENHDQDKRVTFAFKELQQHTSSASKRVRKSRHKDATRRFTLESQENTTSTEFAMNNAFRFLDHSINSATVYVIIEGDQLKISIDQHSEEWFDNILDLVQDLDIVEALSNDLFTIVNQLQTFHQTQKDKLVDVQSQLVIAQAQLQEVWKTQQDVTRKKIETARMKNLRDMHRQREEVLAAKVHTLRINKIFLKKKIQEFKLKKSRLQVNFEMKDYEYREILSRDVSIARRNESFNINRNDSQSSRRDFMNNVLRTTQLDAISRDFFNDVFIDFLSSDHRQMLYEKSKKIRDFYDDHDEWKQWRDDLKFKFWTNDRQFSTNQHKIIYIRKHLRSVAYDTIKHRAKLHNTDSYHFFQEMLDDFEETFETKNEISSKITKFFNFKFFMNKNEIFEQFLARFTALIASLRLFDVIKIDRMKMKIIERMRYKMNLEHITMWKNFVQECRNTWQNIQDMNVYKTARSNISSNISKTIINNRERRRSRNRVTTASKERTDSRISKKHTHNSYRFFNHVVNKIRAEKRCFKCLKKRHRFIDKNVSCKNQKFVDKDDAIVALTKIEIEWNDEETNQKSYASCFDCSFTQFDSKN